MKCFRPPVIRSFLCGATIRRTWVRATPSFRKAGRHLTPSRLETFPVSSRKSRNVGRHCATVSRDVSRRSPPFSSLFPAKAGIQKSAASACLSGPRLSSGNAGVKACESRRLIAAPANGRRRKNSQCQRAHADEGFARPAHEHLRRPLRCLRRPVEWEPVAMALAFIDAGMEYKASRQVFDIYRPNAGFKAEYPPWVESMDLCSTYSSTGIVRFSSPACGGGVAEGDGGG